MQSAGFCFRPDRPCGGWVGHVSLALFRVFIRRVVVIGICALAGAAGWCAEVNFTVATYNLENYIDPGIPSRTPKSMESRARVHESLRRLNADVIALQEIGTTNALRELRESLAAAGLDYPHWEHVAGGDTNIFVAVLSRFPITDRRSHARVSFLLHGRRFQLRRGFAEVDIQVTPQYTFTLLAAHLKSRLDSPLADQAEIRLAEAGLLRDLVDQRLRAKPDLNLVVLGDFNDLPRSEPIRKIIGPRGRLALIDTRPGERPPDRLPVASGHPASSAVTWTYHYPHDDTYTRVDYILLSRGMAREWQPTNSYVLAMPDWAAASDHRPVVAGFLARDL